MRAQTFHSFWHGGPLPHLHWACLASFVDRGHRLRLFTYRALDVPRGVDVDDARTILPEHDYFEFDGSPSAFSNLFRYQLLLRRGGWWVDTDVLCLRADLPDCRYAWAREDDERINGAILKFPAGDATLEAILADARQIGGRVEVQGQLGPKLLTKHLEKLELEDHFGTRAKFYPLHWLEAHLLWSRGGADAIARRIENAAFAHLWGTMFRFLGIDLGFEPPAGSFLASLYERSGPQHALPALDPDAERRMSASAQAFLDLEEMRDKARRFL